MARIRSIKPEFWSSPGAETLEPYARLLFIAMWNWADDNGIGVANPRELLGFAFPLDEAVGLEDVRRWLVDIRRVFGVTFYAVSGRPYYAIPSWEKHQKFDRRSKGKYPAPELGEPLVDAGIEAPVEVARVNPASARRDSVAGTGEQGNRGTEEQGSTTLLVPDERRITAKQIESFFAEFWSVFPKKVAKLSAEKRFTILVKNGADPAEIIAGARAYRESRHGEDPQFTKQPDGWLNAGRWKDEPDPVVVPVGAGTKKAQGWLDIGNMALPEIGA